MDSPGTLFADAERGIYATADHCLWFVDPLKKEVKAMPAKFTSNFRVITHQDYDPYILIFEDSGYLSIFNFNTTICVLSTKFPAQIGIIESVTLNHKTEKLQVSLKSNKATYLYSEGNWTIQSEPIESLVAKTDNKVPSQKAELENEINSAIKDQNLSAFGEAMNRYIFFLALYSTPNTFLSAWYESIKIPTPFKQEDVNNIFLGIIDLLGTVDKVSGYLDELRMVLVS